MVEDEQRLRGEVCDLGFRARRFAHAQPLQPPADCVPRDADETTLQGGPVEARARPGRLSECRAQGVEETGAVGGSRRRGLSDPQHPLRQAHLQPVAEADEGVAPEPLAPLDAL